jgi:hypothetical protein
MTTFLCVEAGVRLFKATFFVYIHEIFAEKRRLC